MVTKDQRLTVMVIPPASRRAYSFTVAPAWIAAVAIFLISIIIMTGRLWYLSARVEELQRNLGELEVLRRTNRIQQSRIEEMQRTSELIQIRLQELELLEGEIHQINGQIREAYPAAATTSRLEPRSPAAAEDEDCSPNNSAWPCCRHTCLQTSGSLRSENGKRQKCTPP